MESRSLANNHSQVDLQAGNDNQGMRYMPAYDQGAGEGYGQTSEWAAHEEKSKKRSKRLVSAYMHGLPFVGC